MVDFRNWKRQQSVRRRRFIADKFLDVSERTILSDIKKLEDYLEYKGNKKTGGYFLKDSIKQVLDSAE